jgi:hypothetical protein
MAYAKQKSGGSSVPTTGTVINLGPCNGNDDATCFKQKYAVVYAVHHMGDKNSAIPCKGEGTCAIEIKMELFFTLDDVERRLKPREEDVTILDNGGQPVQPGSSSEVSKDDVVGIYALTPVTLTKAETK